MERPKQNKIALISCFILVILVGILYLENSNLKWQLVYEKSIPDVELINYIAFDSKNVASGSATGFVAFDDKEKQSRGLRQYIQITASDDFENGAQIFYLTDIIKMDALAPRYFDPVALTIKNIAGGVVTLADSVNNLYFIDKVTSEVSMFDGTKDAAKLITSDSEYGDFMREFLK